MDLIEQPVSALDNCVPLIGLQPAPKALSLQLLASDGKFEQTLYLQGSPDTLEPKLSLTSSAAIAGVSEQAFAVLKRYAGGERNFSGIVLQDVDLSGVILNDVNLEYANLVGVCLRGARLQGACLQNADLSDAVLQDADLSYADLAQANLTGAIADWMIVTAARLPEGFVEYW
jgi:hypothetical protein